MRHSQDNDDITFLKKSLSVKNEKPEYHGLLIKSMNLKSFLEMKKSS